MVMRERPPPQRPATDRCRVSPRGPAAAHRREPAFCGGRAMRCRLIPLDRTQKTKYNGGILIFFYTNIIENAQMFYFMLIILLNSSLLIVLDMLLFNTCIVNF